VFKTALSLPVGDGRFDSFPPPPSVPRAGVSPGGGSRRARVAAGRPAPLSLATRGPPAQRQEAHERLPSDAGETAHARARSNSRAVPRFVDATQRHGWPPPARGQSLRLK